MIDARNVILNKHRFLNAICEDLAICLLDWYGNKETVENMISEKKLFIDDPIC